MSDQPFIADLHVHSRFSRATARNLDLENLYIWAQYKGIRVVGTGDFTHPQWFGQIEEKLEPAEPGLFRLRDDIARCCDEQVPQSCRAPVRFMLSCEISNIYKKADRTRKNHNLVYFANLEHVRHFNRQLDEIGNIQSDGRPILGLDARDLLEIVLETSSSGFLVPAHIWTPWFSMLGSKSGFDSIQSCFGDLSDHIFAAETGLSSDPPMNWRVADLDRIVLISNSDAHSPSKLGREANLFRCALDYHAMRRALATKDRNGFIGTLEFYPQEGKYHADGHRNCQICFSPTQTRSHFGNCPVCGKPLTLGVLHRVEELASRSEGESPDNPFSYASLIPLDDLLSHILQVGPQSKKVRNAYFSLLSTLGNELTILHSLDRATIESANLPLLGEAISRMRENRIDFHPGYDGLYGRVQIFSESERDQLLGQRSLFDGFSNPADTAVKPPAPTSTRQPDLHKEAVTESPDQSQTPTLQLNAEQQAAVEESDQHQLIIAGPGTGKTRTLTHKIVRLIQEGASVDQMAAVTFTNKAAGEMKERLAHLLGPDHPLPFVGTFHGMGYRLINEKQKNSALNVIDETTRMELIGDTLSIAGKPKNRAAARSLLANIVEAKQQMIGPEDDLQAICKGDDPTEFRLCYRSYEELLRIHRALDFEDLIYRAVRRLTSDETIGLFPSGRLSHLFIDEYQDINPGQYQLVRLLAKEEAAITAIGDPDQAIYGFRGSDTACFDWFKKDYPRARTIYLTRNYRSTQTILNVSAQVIDHNPQQNGATRRLLTSDRQGEATIRLMEAATAHGEAVAIGKTIEKMVGGTGFFSIDSGVVDGGKGGENYSFGDFAVLYRTRQQAEEVARTLSKASIPCQRVDRQALNAQPGIRAIVAAFKLIEEGGMVSDIQAARPVFKHGLSQTTLACLNRWAYQNRMTVSEAMARSRRLPIPDLGVSRQQLLVQFINQVVQCREETAGMDTADRLAWIADQGDVRRKNEADPLFEMGWSTLLRLAGEYGDDSSGLLTAATLCAHTDLYDPRVEKVALMTMHAAKGLEFPVVFICGCEEEIIPLRDARVTSDREEERRLFYVALTRAREHLFLTRADRRRIHGTMRSGQWSPFVKEIENRYKRNQKRSAPKGPPAQEQLSLF